MKRLLKDSRGFALLLALLIMSLVVTVTLQFNTSMRSELHGAANLQDGARLACIARSGFDYALAVLSEDASETTFDSLHEDWADSTLLAANAASMFEEGRLEVHIIDHSGKIQINRLVSQGKYDAAQKALLARFLGSEEFDLAPDEVDNIVDAIKDWIDADSHPTRFGAESAYYETLEPPYPCKNAPLEFLEELLRIKGITQELFYGTGEKQGISGYLTTRGDGRININTADALVLRALSNNLTEDNVDDMIAYREDEDNDLSKPSWYRNAGVMSNPTMDALITTSSTYFEIKSYGLKESMHRGVEGLVKRDKKKGTLTVLSWKSG